MNPAVPPRLDSTAPSKPLPPTPERSNSHRDSSSKTPNRYDMPPMPVDHDGSYGEYAAGWEAQEEMRQRELEEARARASQMEKTMRWWSDCTANWREKWSKVRNERNKSREECKQLRFKLEHAIKECINSKRDRENLSSEVLTLKKQLEVYVNMEKERASVCSSGSHRSNTSEQDGASNLDTVDKDPSVQNANDDFVTALLSKSDHMVEVNDKPPQDGSKSDEMMRQLEYSALGTKLEEMKKAFREEQMKNVDLMKDADASKGDLTSWKKKYDDQGKQMEILSKELAELKLLSKRAKVTYESEDESGSEVDYRLTELRKELEKLQAENAKEWTKSERLETEKLAYERENKKLKAEIENLQEEINEQTKNAIKLHDSDVKAVEMELVNKTKELHDLKHSHSKMKKQLQEKTAELDHALSRADQYESEVKKLRFRVEELKKELASAEDEADQQAHQVRKLLRTNDELQQQNENMNVRVQHLQTRLKSASQPSLLSTTHASSLKNFDLSYSPTDGTSDNDVEDD